MEIVFEWDAKKARTNIEKHNISFEEAQTIFADLLLVTFADEVHSQAEERFISIGISTRQRVLLVVHTEREEINERIIIRMISCRRATFNERKIYEEKE